MSWFEDSLVTMHREDDDPSSLVGDVVEYDLGDDEPGSEDKGEV